jgi:hypothetical protein
LSASAGRRVRLTRRRRWLCGGLGLVESRVDAGLLDADDERRQHTRERLPSTERKVLHVVRTTYQRPTPRDTIARGTDCK